MKRREPTPEERRLWREVTQRDKKSIPEDFNSPLEGEPYHSGDSVGGKAVKLAPHGVARATPAPPQGGSKKEVSSREAKQLFTKIDATLDLHGLTQDEAHEKLLRFIAAARKSGKRRLLIITGKGKGILKKSLPLWLDSPKLAGQIGSIASAGPEKGGEGALYVLLKKPK